jgi:hypothetical protein
MAMAGDVVRYMYRQVWFMFEAPSLSYPGRSVLGTCSRFYYNERKKNIGKDARPDIN